eukprot:1292488-Rhodomonas_salina.1
MSRTMHVTTPGRKAHGRLRSTCLEFCTRPRPAERPTAGCEANAFECCTQQLLAERPTSGCEANVLLMLATMPG